MKMLIMGKGEVGTALYNILKDTYVVTMVGKENNLDSSYDVLHICFPFSDQFIDIVKEYKKKYLKEYGLLINHSTVPVGTSDAIDAVHSPIRGIHPHLEEGIKTFVKYFGGMRAMEAARIFENLGIKTCISFQAKDTEALKLFDTLYYAWNIVFNKEVKKYCDGLGLDFSLVYDHGNRTYNEGYKLLGREEVVRPVLQYMGGSIGGHCLVPNAKMLDSWMAKLVLEKNETYG